MVGTTRDDGTAPPAGARRSRRDLLRYALAGAAITAGLVVLKRVFVPAGLSEGGRATFEALLDTLLPEDGLPGWRATRVMPRLAEEIARNRRGRRALVEGVAWLDREARSRHGAAFASLAASDRAAIVRAAEEEGLGTVPHYFYRVVRDRAMQLHFAHPAVWRAIGLPHAPQPEGYLDFAEAPRG